MSANARVKRVKAYPFEATMDHKGQKKQIDIVKKVHNKLDSDKQGKLSPLKSALEKAGHHLSFDDIRLARLFL